MPGAAVSSADRSQSFAIVRPILVHRKRPHLGNAGKGVNRQLPHLGDAGMRLHRKRPHLGDAGMGLHRKLPHLGNAGMGAECEVSDRTSGTREALFAYLFGLAERLRRVRVCCGDWEHAGCVG